MPSQEPNARAAVPGIRWWPIPVVLLLAIARLAWIWGISDTHRQGQVLGSFFAFLWTLGLLLIWMLAFSRARWKLRLIVVGGVLALGGLVAATVEVRGVSGDVVPILGWRWTSAERPLAPVPAEGPSVGETPPVSTDFDYPQYLGPARDAIVSAVHLDPDWEASPPRPLWRQPIGPGWSGFAVVGNFAVTQEQDGDDELVTCYELLTGRRVWAHRYPARFEDPLGGPGPRATPSIAGGRVYALGGTGILTALDLATGREIWSVDTIADNGATVPVYGVSASPLVLDDQVVVLAGGTGGRSLVAYRGTDGGRLWSGGDDPAGYSSPLVADIAGETQIVVFNGRNVVAHQPSDGGVLWEYPWPGETQNVAQPLVLSDDRLLVSSGYGVGSRLFRVRGSSAKGFAAEPLWESRGLKAKLSNFVQRDEVAYGLDDGVLVAVHLEDGRRAWKRGRYGHGQLLLVDEFLLILAENGDVALVEARPEAYRELVRIEGIEGKTWNTPALSGPYLLLRNNREAACIELPII